MCADRSNSQPSKLVSRNRAKTTLAQLSLAVLLSAVTFISPSAFAEPLPTEKDCSKVENPSKTVKGWCVAVNRRKGNCLACHTINTPDWPEGFPVGGNTAPPLVAMKARFPDRAKLASQIADARDTNADSMMPPFLAHGILTEEQIDDIVEFLYSF